VSKTAFPRKVQSSLISQRFSSAGAKFGDSLQMKESPDLSNAVSTSAEYLNAKSPQTQRILGSMVQMVLAQPLVAPQRVVLRTQHRSMAATPLVVRATRQTRVARCAATAAADTSKVRCGQFEH